MISKPKNNLFGAARATCDVIVAGSLAMLTILSLTGLAGCNLNDSFAATDSKETMVSTGLASKLLTADRSVHMEKQPKRIVVTGEMGIVLPRTGQPYGTVEDKKTGQLYNIYGCDINLHKKVIQKLQAMYDAKKWPVDIKATGFLKSPDFIADELDNTICITDPDHIAQRP